MKVYLASQSKGRLTVLTEAGYDVIVCPTFCDENGEWSSVPEMTENLAIRKMTAFLKSGNYTDSSIPAISADTVVSVDGKVIGKADSAEEALYQLRMLSGRTHSVYSSYCVSINGKTYHGTDRADVSFNDIENLIPSYIESGEWKGAAGSYRIQGQGMQFIKSVCGDINTVIGLPLAKIEEKLAIKVK